MAIIVATMSASVTLPSLRPELSGEALNSAIYDVLSAVFEKTEKEPNRRDGLRVYLAGGLLEQSLRSDIRQWAAVAEHGIRSAALELFSSPSFPQLKGRDDDSSTAEWSRFLQWLLVSSRYWKKYPPGDRDRFYTASIVLVRMAQVLADLGICISTLRKGETENKLINSLGLTPLMIHGVPPLVSETIFPPPAFGWDEMIVPHTPDGTMDPAHQVRSGLT